MGIVSDLGNADFWEKMETTELTPTEHTLCLDLDILTYCMRIQMLWGRSLKYIWWKGLRGRSREIMYV